VQRWRVVGEPFHAAVVSKGSLETGEPPALNRSLQVAAAFLPVVPPLHRADFRVQSAHGLPETDFSWTLCFRTDLPLLPHLGALEGRVPR